MTPNEFRTLALGVPGAIESQHGGHPDFRIGGKVFASLGVPDEHCGMVKLSREEQCQFVEQAPEAFQPVKGSWGERGYTRVQLEFAAKDGVKAALSAAAEVLTSALAKKRPRP